MAVRLKFGNDLNISGSSRGASGSVFAPPSGGGGGFPAYGTVLYTEYGYEYALGTDIYSALLAALVKNQICDVDVVADGVGGSFVDWVSAGNIQYKPYGTFVAYDAAPWADGSLEVPTGSYVFVHTGEWSGGRNEIHDGLGNLIYEGVGTFNLYPYGTFTGQNNYVDNMVEVPSASFNYFSDGTGYTYPYLLDGVGGYYQSVSGTPYGSYISSGVEVDSALRYDSGSNESVEVPSGSMMYFGTGRNWEASYYWDGTGGYYSNTTGNTVGSFYSYGTFIYNDGTYDYYWDGSGGYYI